jgi:hypothetical protein
MARSDGDISARGMQVVYALRRPLLELANEFPTEATKYFLELLEECYLEGTGYGPSWMFIGVC